MNENKIAKILLVIGIVIMVFGFVAGIFVAVESNQTVDDFYFEEELMTMDSTFQFSVFFSIFFNSFVTGMIFIGFSEVIRLLHEINWKTTSPPNGK